MGRRGPTGAYSGDGEAPQSPADTRATSSPFAVLAARIDAAPEPPAA